jgi:hypothetical protein
VIHCEWEEASCLLNKLSAALNKSDTTYVNNDMKIRYVSYYGFLVFIKVND